jgi:hypothetical protein
VKGEFFIESPQKIFAFLMAYGPTEEIDLDRNHISWVSPLGRALTKSAAPVIA